MQASRTEFAHVRNGRHKRRGSGQRTYVSVSGCVIGSVGSVDRCSVVPACPVLLCTSVRFMNKIRIPRGTWMNTSIRYNMVFRSRVALGNTYVTMYNIAFRSRVALGNAYTIMFNMGSASSRAAWPWITPVLLRIISIWCSASSRAAWPWKTPKL